jgi:TonB family protein
MFILSRCRIAAITAVACCVASLCGGVSFAALAAETIVAARNQRIQAAWTQLQKQEAADWQAVIAADKAEIAALNSDAAANRKAGNPKAVVVDQVLLNVVQARLWVEEARTAFPQNFQITDTADRQYAARQHTALKIEITRSKAVAAAVASANKAQAAFHDAVAAADQAAITQWKQQAAADVKAGNPKAVVVDMSEVGQAQQQLRLDSRGRGAFGLGGSEAFVTQWQVQYHPGHIDVSGSGGSGAMFVPPTPTMPPKYQSGWPAHLINPKFLLTIRRNGTVAAAEVLISSGHASIDQAIIKSLTQAQFSPSITAGKPVQTTFVIRYNLVPSPHFIHAKRTVAKQPIRGYIFRTKSGTQIMADTYTTGSFYYHLKWNGINLLVAKDLVVKIRTVR